MRVEIASENALIIYFGAEKGIISPVISAQVQYFGQQLERALGKDLIDLVPSYASLLVIYDPFRCDHFRVKQCIRELEAAQAWQSADLPSDAHQEIQKTVVLPVWYSEESGPDLRSLSERAGLSMAEVIHLHQQTEYQVYAIGFAPGFAYLGQVDERIAAPRLATPRLKVPRGAVAIADRQTAVYPSVSPGGWNLIGLCPTRLFDPLTEPTMPVSVGDKVRFHAIERTEFLSLGGELP